MKFRNFLLILIIFLFSTFSGISQPTETTYLGSVAKSGSDNNSFYGPFNIGFNFTFFGNSYTEFFISSNGLISFGEGYDYPGNYSIPDATVIEVEGVPIVPNVPNNYIAPFWDDLTIDASGNILYTTIGAAPNRKLIVQFRNMGFYGGPVYMGTFSVILYETTGLIQTQYRILVLESSTRAHGSSATIGVENIDGTAGALYSFNNSSAIISRQAISYTPSGGNYIVNPNAVYDGVYLTKNLTLPEPGITALISPAENATIGPDPTFTWSASTNAVSYSLKLSTNSSLSGALSYNAGSNLSYSLTGLIPGTTYYWGVFATNATGTTWGEVRKFIVSSNPPLAAVSQTIYTEQTVDKTIKLNYTGGDASAKTAIITSIPGQGQLYQYNAGARGALISSVGTPVSDANMNVIYYASGSPGNSVGNFSFRVHDDTGDSPTALITVNVSPPGIPNLLYVAKSTYLEMQFDRPMADPAGKQTEFTATVNGSVVAVSSLSLKTGDNYSIIATLSTPLAGGEIVLLSYTAGTIASAQGGWLATFTDQSVTLTAQTITFTQPLDRKYSDSPFTLTATATGGALTYSSSNPGVATAVGSVLTFHALGSSDITARQAGDATYAPAKYTRTLVVSIGDQSITFGPLASRNVGDADYLISAVASSGLPVTFVSGNLSVATVSGSIVHIVGAGTAIITASQEGNSNFNAAINVQQTLTVIDATSKTLNLTSVFLQGLYSGAGTMNQAYDETGAPHWPAGIADMITIELHDASTYSTIIYTSDDVPLSTTGVASVSIPSALGGSYYVTIKHRNSIETTTSVPVSFSSGTINYAFDLPSKVYGGNLELMSGSGTYYAIYGGDSNKDGVSDGLDLIEVENGVTLFSMGYLDTDLNSDGIVDAIDLILAENNAYKFVAIILP